MTDANGLPYLDKLRGVILYEDGVPVFGAGRVRGIDFLNSTLSYNRITGVATVSLGDNLPLSITPGRLLGRYTSPAGSVQEVTPSGNIELTSLGFLQRGALTGDVTAAAGSGSTTLRNAAGNSVLARSAATTGPLADVTAGTEGHALRLVAGVLAFGALVTASLGDSIVTHAKYQDIAGLSVVGRSAGTTGAVGAITGTEGQALRVASGVLGFGTLTSAVLGDIATDRLLGRDTAGTGAAEQLTVSGGIEFTGSGGIQTSAFTGDVTKAAGGTAQTIAANAVTFAKFQNISTDRLLGRDTASSGLVEEISLNATLEFTGSTSIQRAALTGDITASAGSNATAFRNFSALSVLGRSANSSGAPADIAGTDGQVFRIASNVLGFGTIATAGIGDNQVTFAKIQQIATDRLLGRDSSGTGNVEEISLNGTLEWTGAGAIQRAALTGDITATAGSNSTAFRNGAAVSVLGRSANSVGAIADIVAASGQILFHNGTALVFGTPTSASISAPGSTTQVIYNNAGAFDAAANITVIGEAAFAFGATPASAGALRFTNTNTGILVTRDAGNTADVNIVRYDTLNNMLFGDPTNGGDLYFDAKTGQTLHFRVNNTDELTVTASTVNAQGNAVSNGSSYAVSGTPAAAGQFRGAHGSTAILSSRDQANAADAGLVYFGLGANDRLTFGDTEVANTHFNIATSGVYTWQINGASEMVLSASTLDMEGNSVTDAGFISFGGTVAASGLVRADISSSVDLLVGRLSGSDREFVSYDSGTGKAIFGADSLDLRLQGEHLFDAIIAGAAVLSLKDDGTNSISPINIADASATSFVIRAAGSTASNNAGGDLILRGGRRAGTGSLGGVRLDLNDNDSTTPTMVEAVDLGNSNRRILSLCALEALTSTHMPSGSGDGVVFIHDADTVPATASASDPTEGVILFADNTAGLGGLRVRGKSRLLSTVTPGRTGSVAGDHQIYEGLQGTTSVAGSATGVTLVQLDLNLLTDGAGGGNTTFLIRVHTVGNRTTTASAPEAIVQHIVASVFGGTWAVNSSQAVTNHLGQFTVPGFTFSGSTLTGTFNNNSANAYYVSCFVTVFAVEP
jgi:hypothetical protein